MLIKDNYKLRRVVEDMGAAYNHTVMSLINSTLSTLKTPDEFIHFKNTVVYSLCHCADVVKGDSPFVDERISLSLLKINDNLFPDGEKIEYPYNLSKLRDIDYGSLHKALNINICKHFIYFIREEQDVFDDIDDEQESKRWTEAIKALKAEIKRIQSTEIKDRTDIYCTGREPF